MRARATNRPNTHTFSSNAPHLRERDEKKPVCRIDEPRYEQTMNIATVAYAFGWELSHIRVDTHSLHACTHAYSRFYLAVWWFLYECVCLVCCTLSVFVACNKAGSTLYSYYADTAWLCCAVCYCLMVWFAHVATFPLRYRGQCIWVFFQVIRNIFWVKTIHAVSGISIRNNRRLEGRVLRNANIVFCRAMFVHEQFVCLWIQKQKAPKKCNEKLVSVQK